MQYSGSTYDALRARHVFQYDAYLGGEHFRAPSQSTLSTATAWRYGQNEDGTEVRVARRYQTYLVAHPAESDEAFEARLARACYLNIVAPIVDSYAEAVTTGVTRDVPDDYGPMDDVDLRGSAWGEHVEEVARWAALFGYVAVVVDAPARNDARNRAEELARGIAPRVVVVQPSAIAWVEVDDVGRLTEFAYVEDAYQDATQAATGTCDVTVRVWTREGWQVRRGRVQTSAGAAGLGAQKDALGELVAKGPLPDALSGELPVVFAYYRRVSASRFPLGQSVVDDACDIARSVYCKLSEEDDLHAKAGFPFLAVPSKQTGGQLDPQTKISIGPGRGLGFDSATGAPQWVQPSSESSKELRESIVFRVATAFRLAGIEVATDQSGQAESGIALRVRARGFEARAARFARCMARYERAALALWGRLAGSAREAAVAYGKRFVLPDPSEDLQTVLTFLKDLPLEVGVEAKVAAVRKALDAALAPTDEELAAMADEARELLEGDKADFEHRRATEAVERQATAAERTVARVDAEQKAATIAATAGAATPDDPKAKDPTTALNGAQVASLLEIVGQVARREIPRDTGVALITLSFPVTPADADRAMGDVGRGFFAEAPAPPPSPFGAPAAPPPAAKGKSPKPGDDEDDDDAAADAGA